MVLNDLINKAHEGKVAITAGKTVSGKLMDTAVGKGLASAVGAKIDNLPEGYKAFVVEATTGSVQGDMELRQQLGNALALYTENGHKPFMVYPYRGRYNQFELRVPAQQATKLESLIQQNQLSL